MIIGFDASRAFKENRTGTEEYSYQLLKNLIKVDSKNQYLIYTNPFINEPIGQLMKFPKNFKVVEIKWPRLWTQGGLALETFKDVLHPSKMDALFVPAHTLPIIRIAGLKTVLTVHDLGSEYLPQMHQIKQRLYLSFMQKYQFETANKIIAVSKATKDDLRKKIGCDPKKIEVIYEGYNKTLFKLIKDDILVNSLRQYGLVKGGYFLFVGTVQPRKNLDRLINAFSKVVARLAAKKRYFLTGSDFATPSLVVVGQRGWLTDEIYKLPKILRIEDKVKFLGYVPEKDLPALYSGALALTFPSLFEGFGLPILEAQACACPVLTSNTSSMPEVAGKGAILVDPYNVDDIANAMIRITEKSTRRNLINSGFNNIKRFSWEKCARETLAVLEKTAKQINL